MADIYRDWGFIGNPFEPIPLPPTSQGRQLCVGRDGEIRRIRTRWDSSSRCVTIEGNVGAGKTSIVNVAAFEAMAHGVENPDSHLYVPCVKSIQLDRDETAQEFLFKVYVNVAQSLIKYASEIGEEVDRSLDAWINNPILEEVNGSLTAFGFGIGGGGGVSVSESMGFEFRGFVDRVRSWVHDIFSDRRGGVVVVLDNIELMHTVSDARSRIESLRDEMFNDAFMRWVFCGAQGIVNGVVSSPRLNGYLHEPITVREIQEGDVQDLLLRRYEVYSRGGSAYEPVIPEDFYRLYNILQCNLRDALGCTQDYCLFIAERESPQDKMDKKYAFHDWLSEVSARHWSEMESNLTKKTVDVMQQVHRLGRPFSPGEYEMFGFNAQQGMRPYIRDLEAMGLVSSTVDEDDNRRRTISITAKGCLALHHIDSG